MIAGMVRPGGVSLPLGVLCAVLLLMGGGVTLRVCAAPVDLSGAATLPAPIASAKSNDDFAYWAHAATATLLDALGCAPAAAGLQWLKAAAHARSADEEARATRGLARQRERGAPPGRIDATLCSYVEQGFASPRQASVATGAGLRCAGPRTRP